MVSQTGVLWRLIATATEEGDAAAALGALRLDAAHDGHGAAASRAQVAVALNVALFADLLRRVPTAAAYVAQLSAHGGTAIFDHGALRTVDGETGALPRGCAAFARLLEPMGYALAGTYPLPRLRMTGRAYAHRDDPEGIPQFFVSELHVAELPVPARDAAQRVFGDSRDPLGDAERGLLDALARDGEAPLELACTALPGLVAAFGRQHPRPAFCDYETLLAHSAEGAWIATEGNAFNHATDRVPDVSALALRLRAQGWPVKAGVEVSRNGRVRQTAFLADRVRREFTGPDGSVVTREVPGSFYEFISRDVDPETGRLDLSFDSGNATGIFAVTSAR